MLVNGKHIHHIHSSFKKEIDEIYLSTAIKQFAVGLVGLFVPIYVYLMTDSIPLTFLVFASQYLVYAFLMPWTAHWPRKIGVKKQVAISNPFLALYLFFLVLAQNGSLWWLAAAITAAAVYLALFWPAYHIEFSEFSSRKERGREVGGVQIATALAKAAAPFIGGIVIVEFGFGVLFTIASFLIIISALPLFWSADIYDGAVLSWQESMKKIIDKKEWRRTLALFCEGVEYMAGLFFFPILIYLVIPMVEEIGWISSLSLLVVLIFTHRIGKLTDRWGGMRVAKLAAPLHSLAWILNGFITNPMNFLGYSIYFRLTELSIHLPFSTLVYAKAADKKNKYGPGDFVAYSSIVHTLGKVVMALFIVIGFYLGLKIFWPYLIAAAAASLGMRVWKE